jgi:uncharacterized membrane protein
MAGWGVFAVTFLTAGVEWVEAFTIVLAVSLGIGWRAAGGAALAALLLLAVLTVATGGAVAAGLQTVWFQAVIGIFLLLFGLRWLAKAVARQAGLKAFHDETQEFAETREKLAGADRQAGWIIAFQGVLLEGLEVWLIVVALGVKGGHVASATLGALAALVMVILAGIAIRAPLARVPENAIKFLVGAAVTGFGSFWTVEALAGPSAWPWGDAALPVLVLFYLLGGLGLVVLLRTRRRVSA